MGPTLGAESIARFNVPDNERLRSNDGAVDPHGRLWVGTMTDFGLGPFQPEGENLPKLIQIEERKGEASRYESLCSRRLV